MGTQRIREESYPPARHKDTHVQSPRCRGATQTITHSSASQSHPEPYATSEARLPAVEQTRATTEPKSLPTSRKEATISVSRVMIPPPPPPQPVAGGGGGGGEEEALLASITIYRPGIYQLFAASALTWPEEQWSTGVGPGIKTHAC